MKELAGVAIDPAFAEPQIDIKTGQLYCVKCHATIAEELLDQLPKRPYELVEASPAADIWAFGLLMFQLCSGRPLMSIDERSGHLLDICDIVDWTMDRAMTMIYSYISDPLAQDILLRLLAPIECRRYESFISILDHPFFNHSFSATETSLIVERRRKDESSFKRLLQKRGAGILQSKLLQERTVTLSCWDFDVLKRIYLSPTELVRRSAPKNMDTVPEITFPCAIVLLPYHLKTRRENFIESAQTLGLEILRLSKICCFTRKIEQFQASKNGGERLGASGIAKLLGLSSDHFAKEESTILSLASRFVELYRDDPVAVALMVMQEQLKTLLECFETAETYLYMLDEYNCKLLSNEVYPIQVPDNKRQTIVRNGLLFMYLCYQHTKGRTNGLAGLAQLLFNDGDYEVPPSWVEAAEGLTDAMDEDAWFWDIRLLERALGAMFESRYGVASDSLDVIQDFLYSADRQSNFADQTRVLTGEISLWTTSEGVQEIRNAAVGTSFKDVLRKMTPK